METVILYREIGKTSKLLERGTEKFLFLFKVISNDSRK